MVKIVIIDDHTLFRMGLIALFEKESGLEIAGEFSSYGDVHPNISKLDAHLILLDVSLQDESGIEVAKCIKKNRPSMKIIFLSSHKEEFYLINAVEANVDGYIHKAAHLRELVLGIKKVIQGEKFYSQEISNLLVDSFNKKTCRGLPFLTYREKEIVNYLMEGYSSKEIASTLGISPRTIDSHRANVLEKFGLKNTTELVSKISKQKIRF
ncbi:response regulator transcription factor [Chryseolinea soli]|uniref:DNA-binding response regulator n=1 Tax=Chryseolinea soli TaxID=2321403 RepID=A0A385SJY3_9BACT|nr:response regulator transcription factor [Chryseolinea soli]AYB32063.1 DNA-binding response regulator [Chryseolinea soli]